MAASGEAAPEVEGQSRSLGMDSMLGSKDSLT